MLRMGRKAAVVLLLIAGNAFAVDRKAPVGVDTTLTAAI